MINPYAQTKNNLFIAEPSDVEGSALYCLLSVLADGYTSGYTRVVGRTEARYVVEELRETFGNHSPAVLRLEKMLQRKINV